MRSSARFGIVMDLEALMRVWRAVRVDDFHVDNSFTAVWELLAARCGAGRCLRVRSVFRIFFYII